MGCVVSRKHLCPLCRDHRRSFRDLLCDKCAFVREYTVLHGREGLRVALRRQPYDAPGLQSAAVSTSSLAAQAAPARGSSGRCYSMPDRYATNPRFMMVKPAEPSAPPYCPGQGLPEH